MTPYPSVLQQGFGRFFHARLMVVAAGMALWIPAVHAQNSLQAPTVTEAREPAPRAITLPALPSSFKHPGLLNTKAELEFVRKKIEAGEEPWKSAFEQMKGSPWAAVDYKPKAARDTISSGINGSGSQEGGVAQASIDAKAAYTQALMWNFTGDERYARNAAAILNNWSILRENRGGNWYLQAAWLASTFTNAAELVRHTWTGWKPEEIKRFSEMLNEAFLPIFHNRPAYGNRLFSVSYAMMAIGVFNEDKAAFTEGLHRWLSYVPCWIYLKEDGPNPIRPDYWLTTPSNDELAALDAQLFPDVKKSWIYREDAVRETMKANKLGDDSSTFKTASNLDKGGRHWNSAPEEAYIDGLSAETYRDLGHCDLGFAGVVSSAEIALNQGIDLYALEAKRIIAFLELHAALRIDETVPPAFYRVRGTPVQSFVEAAYNHYHNRMGLELPKTKAFIDKALRPCLKKEINGAPGWSWVPVEHGIRAENVVWPISCNVAWETLTHANTGPNK
jgi:hypothetical protein